MPKKEFERLPSNVIPRKYRLKYDEIDLVAFRFTGTVEIDVEVKEETNVVKMNALELWLMSAEAEQDDERLTASNIDIHFEKQEASITFPSPLKVGRTTLTIEFQGILNDKLAGFYRSTYTLDGEKRVMATTQFEATDARRAFPCWDEPACKASFEVCLTIPADRIAISNTPCINMSTIEKNGQKYKICQFDETPVMSSYLLAFVVGEFDQVSAYTKEGVLTTVYTPVGKSEQGRFALRVACEALSFFQSFFGVEYPLRKSDLLAIPDFAAGAMENWGCVTYREAALLIDEAQSSAAMRTRVAMVVCHELAHQWFGNLVTMEWWTHLWLNEGFATFMQYVAVDHIFPEWDIWTEFVTAVQMKAMGLDALSSSHPIEVEVGHPDEVDEIFDAISYQKGASLIRMVETFVGREKMKEGLKLYLTRHAYGNALTEQLWAALSEVSGKDVAGLMAGWTAQMGYPVLHLSDDGGIAQTRFLALKHSDEGSAVAKADAGKLWRVPVDGVTLPGGGAVQTAVVDAKSVAWIGDGACAPGFKLNIDQTGFFRVNYTAAQWNALKPHIASGELRPRDRIGLISDAFALAKGLAWEFRGDENYSVWDEISSNVAGLASLYSTLPCFPAFRRFVCELYSPVAGRLGWDAKETDGNTTLLFRSTVLNMLGSVGGDAETISVAKAKFKEFMDSGGSGSLAPDLRQLCYKLAIDSEDLLEASAAFDAVEGLMLSSTLSEEKRRCMGALGRSRHSQLIDRALRMALDDTKVRSQDMYLPFSSVGSNRHGRDHAWAFFRSELPAVKKVGGLMLIGYIVNFVTCGFASDEKAAEVTAFFEENPLPSASRKIQQSVEGIRCKAKRISAEAADVEQFCAKWK